MVTQRSKKSFPSLDDLLISSDGHVLSDNTDGGEEEDKQRHNDVNIMTKIDYDSQAILDRIGKCPNEYHNLYQQSKERGIPHIRQDETWDCGLTCIQMILEWLRAENVVDDIKFINGSTIYAANDSIRQKLATTEKEWMIEFVATKSIWTIDLVVLVQKILSCSSRISHNTNNYFTDKAQESDARDCSLGCQLHLPNNFSYLFCSTNFGVEKSYNSLEYYQENFTSDELRIQNHFRRAHEQNLPLLQTSHLSLQVLAEVISRKGVVAIVLLDNNILRNTFTSDSYSGHYVILCGISSDEDDIQYAHVNYPDEDDCTPHFDFCIVMKNPASWKEVEYVTPSIFEKAWRARGTDEDVIFISKHARGAG